MEFAFPKIIKVQAPHASNDDTSPWLIYDQLKARMCQIPGRDIPQFVKDIVLKEKSLKSFFEGEWNAETHRWTIVRKTHWRLW